MPPGIPYIVGNEAAERFSFYGMRAILVVFMTQYLVNSVGELDVMSEAEAKGWYHLFVSAVYFTPLLGALISDVLLGKYPSIIALSIVYCLGHFVLALDDTRSGLTAGLTLIALGAGGIKPCVSAHVGDQFGQSNQHLLPKAFSWFYFAINLGAFTSTLLTPWVLVHHGSSPAFALPGILMLLATVIFWAGRHRFVHVPPAGRTFLLDVLGAAGLRVVAKLVSVFVFIAVFWSLFDQTGSAWVLQARHMDREILGVELLPAQLQAANPLLVLILIPTFAYGVYPALERVMTLSPLRKISIGLFVTALAFLVPTLVQEAIDGGATPHIAWQLLAYLLLTCGEVMVSITGLEFAYTQAPLRMKSFVMSLFMLSIAAGNLFTSAINFLIETGTLGTLDGAAYYWFFTALMAGAALLFLLVVRFYREKTYIHTEEPIAEAHAVPEP
jgi:POT family proton-dependent oligopeptide transporter